LNGETDYSEEEPDVPVRRILPTADSPGACGPEEILHSSVHRLHLVGDCLVLGPRGDLFLLLADLRLDLGRELVLQGDRLPERLHLLLHLPVPFRDGRLEPIKPGAEVGNLPAFRR
jgi:hypothetical protein